MCKISLSPIQQPALSCRLLPPGEVPGRSQDTLSLALNLEQRDMKFLLPPAVPCQQGRPCSALPASTAPGSPQPRLWGGNSRTYCPPSSPCPPLSTRGTQSLVCPPADTNRETKVVASVSQFSWSHAPKVQLIELPLIFYLAGGSLLTPSCHKLGPFAPTGNPQVVLCIFHLQPKRGLSTTQETSQEDNLGCNWCSEKPQGEVGKAIQVPRAL